MILKTTQLLHLFNSEKEAKTTIKKAPLTSQEKIKEDRIVTALFFTGVFISSLLYNIL